MAFRWSNGTSPAHAIKRGLASLFVCFVIILPIILTGMTIQRLIGPADQRKAKALPTMQIREMDANHVPIRPFEEPLITVTFDDGWETVYTESMPILQKYGIPTTQYVLSDVDKDHSYLSFAQMKVIEQGGHEIACHTETHPDLTTLKHSDLLEQLNGCKTTLKQKLGVDAREFAAPYGHNNAETIAAIKDTFRSSRNTNGDITTNQADDQDVNVKESFNPYDITAITLRGDTTVAQLQAAIDYTVQHNGWLVLNYHQVDEGDDSKFALTNELFTKQIQAVNKAPSRIITMGQFLDALQQEKK
jgi:peptidoglycan/xylan/chitin deacetylase (PgdA/CDA1 family)